jgi:hypothetical protein
MEEGTLSGLPSELPPLPYSLHTRKKAIAIFWTIFVIDTLGQPVILYWTLWYCTDLSHNLGTLDSSTPRVDYPEGQSLIQRGSLFHRHRLFGRCLRL